MSWQALAAVWKADLQPVGLKMVAAVMADRADEAGGSIRYSMETIAWRAGLSRRQVVRYVGDLVKNGALQIVKVSTQHHPPHYRLNLQSPALAPRGDMGVTSESPRGDMGVTSEPQPGAALTAPRGDTGVTSEPPRGDTGDHQGCHAGSPGVTPTSPNTPQRRPEATLGGGGAAAAPGLAPGLAAPPGVDAGLWKSLTAKRTPEEMQEFAEGIEYHVGQGCPLSAVNTELVRLVFTGHHKVFTPKYSPRPGGRGASRPRRRAAAQHQDLTGKDYSEGI